MSQDLGEITVLGADAVGPAGQRRFRMFAQSRRGSAVMWMEKEQLNSLSLALDKFLALLTDGRADVLRILAQPGEPPTLEGMPAHFPKSPDHDFRVAQMKLNYNERDDTFLLSAFPLEVAVDQDGEPQLVLREETAISFIFTQREALQLSRAITQLTSTGGRPVCPMCKAPLDGGPHACLQQNGHIDLFRLAEQDEDEA